MPLIEITSDVWAAESGQLVGGLRLPTRMTVIRLSDGALWLHSPVPIDDELAAELEALGSVGHLVAPNKLHHLYLPAAIERYPDATVSAPPGLDEKLPDLRVDLTLGEAAPGSWGGDFRTCLVGGAPAMNEIVFLHRPSGTLIVGDLVFNIQRTEGLLAPLLFRAMGVHGRLGQSRAWRLFFIKDRAAAAASCHRILQWSFERVIVTHGDIVEHDGHAKVAEALAWLTGGTPTIRTESAPA